MDLKNVLANLEKRGFSPRLFDTAAQVADYVAEQLHGKTVGFGGSMTVEGMGLYERLAADNTVLWHWKEKSPDILQRAAESQVYITSANAIAASGEIVNIDGNGNRVAATQFGREKVILISGVNKITEDLCSAIHRARNVAAPKNAVRLNRKTPCTVDGKCHDCSSPERICSIEVVLRGKPGCVGSFEVLLINEELGY